MARYIEREKFLKKCAETFGYAGVTIKAIEGIADECATTDVVPKSEIERLTVELEAMRTAANSYKMHYENLEREIFGEIVKSVASKLPMKIRPIFKKDLNFEDGFRDGKSDALMEVLALIAELKKKYTEGETNG